MQNDILSFKCLAEYCFNNSSILDRSLAWMQTYQDMTQADRMVEENNIKRAG